MEAMSVPAGIGARIRRARQERGLTQKELGGPDFSAAYISQLERDKLRPSLRALEILSRRLDRPLAYFLGTTRDTTALREKWEYAYLRGDAELVRHNRQGAAGHLRQAEELAAQLDDPLRLARTRLRLAGAVAPGDLQEAIRLYTEALRVFEEAGRSHLAAEAALELGQRYHEDHNLLLAVQYYRSALRNAEETPGAQRVAFEAMVALGAAYLELEEPRAAETQLQRAGAAITDLLATGQLAETWLAEAEELRGRGDTRTALEVLRGAHALYFGLGLDASLSRSLRTLAQTLVHLERGQPRRVRGFLKQSLVLEQKIGNPAGQAEALLCLAELEAPGQPGEAVGLLRDALGLAEQAGSSDLQAQILYHWGVIARHEDMVAAERRFEQALDVLEGTQPSALRARIHHELGELLREQGDIARALRHFERATLDLEALR